MKIHGIETGKVRIKKSQIKKSNGFTPKLLKVIMDKEWSEWLPIYCWVIDHPEGIIVVDTGETSKTSLKGYLPQWHPYYAGAVQFKVNPDEEVGNKLRSLGIDPMKDVRKVIMTHLHTDHAGGLYHFPNSEIFIENSEFKSASGITGIISGYLPHRWPAWLHPTRFELSDSEYGPFKESLSVTKDNRIRIVKTPGHTPGHVSVVAESDDINYFIAGDASYNQVNMQLGIPDGIGIDESKNTLEKIRSFSSQRPTVYLPSHESDGLRRLESNEIVPIYKEEVMI